MNSRKCTEQVLTNTLDNARSAVIAPHVRRWHAAPWLQAAAAICSISSTLVTLSRGLPWAAPRRTSSASTRCQPAKSTT